MVLNQHAALAFRGRIAVYVEHTILTAIWSMAHTGALYDDPGADYHIRRDPERLKRHALTQLQRLGYDVTLTPAAASA